MIVDPRYFAYPVYRVQLAAYGLLLRLGLKKVIVTGVAHQTGFSHLVQKHSLLVVPTEYRKEAPAGVSDHGSCQEHA